MNFQNKLAEITKKNNSLLCVGLDPDLDKIPEKFKSEQDPLFGFNKYIIEQTFDLVNVFKPNIAFYEAYGIEGLSSLKKTIEYLKSEHPEIPILLDAKRGDIPNTAERYAKAIYEYWEVDAATVYPHLGKDSLLPFLKYQDKCTILLIKTSNPDSGMLQNLTVEPEGIPYYLKISQEIKNWNFKNIGLFVGATYPDELRNVRKLFPNSPFLTAGLGAQNAEIEQAIKAGVDKDGMNLACNNSREILYSENPREKAKEIRGAINKYR